MWTDRSGTQAVLHAASGDGCQERPGTSSESATRTSRNTRPEDHGVARRLGFRRRHEQEDPAHRIEKLTVPSGCDERSEPPAHGYTKSRHQQHIADIWEYSVERDAAPAVQSHASF